MSQKPSVLVVDDESGILDTLRILLRNEGFEVTTAQAQKLTLAASVGTLSLTLRAAGVATYEATQRVAVNDLAHPDGPPVPEGVDATATGNIGSRRTMSVGVSRGLKRQEYSVPVQAVH